MPQADILQDFKRTVATTRDARFQANLRLVRRHYLSSYLISLLSLYVIALSLYPNIATPQLTQQQTQILLASTIVLSIFIIILSLTESSRNYYHHGEVLHDCAREVGRIYNKLKLIREDDEGLTEIIGKYAHEYEEALRHCHANHQNIDYYRVRASKPILFPKYYTHHWIINEILRWGNWTIVLAGEYFWAAFPLIFVIIISYVCWAYVLRVA